MTPDSSPKKPAASRAWVIAAIVLVLGFDLAFLWQRRAAAPASELGGHPDEAAHYVTGLAVQYFFVSLPEGSFADFSAHYPIVEPILCAPLFPAVQAAWTSAFGKSRTSVLLLMCLLAAVVAMLLHLALRREFGDAAGVIAAALFLSLPLAREHYSMLMPAMLCTAWMFAAMLAFARLLERGRMSDALWFGLCAALAVATDRTGLALALFVPLALLFSGKWSLLVRPPFWIGLALAGLLAWLFHSHAWKGVSLDFTRAAFPFYAAQLAASIGVILVFVCVPGLIIKLCRPAERTARWSTAGALLAGVPLFLILAPGDLDIAGLLPALPAALLFAVAGCAALAQRLARSPAFILLIAAILSIAFFERITVTWRAKKWGGFRPLAEAVIEAAGRPQTRVLVCSDRTGEGMFISEIAMAEPQPERFIQRADTLFANTRFGDDDALANLLTSLRFDYIVFDESNPDLDRSPQHDMLRRVLREHSDRFWEMSSSPVIRDGIPQDAPARLYRVVGRE